LSEIGKLFQISYNLSIV